MARSFHSLRMMPPQQREQVMSSADFRSTYSEAELNTINSLMAVDPYLPPPARPHAEAGH